MNCRMACGEGDGEIVKWIVAVPAVPEPFDFFLASSCLCHFFSQEAFTIEDKPPSNTLNAVWDVEVSQ